MDEWHNGDGEITVFGASTARNIDPALGGTISQETADLDILFIQCSVVDKSNTFFCLL